MKRSPLKRKPRRRKVSEEGAAYMAHVAGQPCLFDYLGVCDGGVQVHHHGRKGLSQKVSDLMTVPLCRRHHLDEWEKWGAIVGLSRAEANEHICERGWRLLVEWLEKVEQEQEYVAAYRAARDEARAENARLREALAEDHKVRRKLQDTRDAMGYLQAVAWDQGYDDCITDTEEGWFGETKNPYLRAALEGGDHD